MGSGANMDAKKTFLMPDYYTAFVCKTGRCRRSCCEGWPVTFSLEDYFRLAGEECSTELRDKIDRGVQICLEPTPDAYARIRHDYYGNCPMRLADGRCGIHAEMGEGALASICRLYPRGIRVEPGYECSMANSCEGVLELMFETDAPIKFVKREIDAYLPRYAGRKFKFETFGKEQALRLWLISILQDRSVGIPLRLMRLGLALLDMQNALDSKSKADIDALFGKSYSIPSDDTSVSLEHLEFGLKIAEELTELIDERSESVREYGKEALEYFAEYGLDGYRTAKEEFEHNIPKWEIWFEHMMVNHMFFEQFPFQDRPDSPWDEFVAICAVYALLRFLAIGRAKRKSTPSDLVDMSAAVFRLVDHTDFDRYASRTLTDLKCDTPQKILDLITL